MIVNINTKNFNDCQYQYKIYTKTINTNKPPLVASQSTPLIIGSVFLFWLCGRFGGVACLGGKAAVLCSGKIEFTPTSYGLAEIFGR